MCESAHGSGQLWPTRLTLRRTYTAFLEGESLSRCPVAGTPLLTLSFHVATALSPFLSAARLPVALNRQDPGRQFYTGRTLSTPPPALPDVVLLPPTPAIQEISLARDEDNE